MLNPVENQFNSIIDKYGKDVKINNQDTRVIMKNINNEFDDKEIITKFDVKQGMYVFYNNFWFMVTSQVNDERYQVYNKATIRRCDHIINFIIDEKLYGFPVVFTTADMAMRDSKLWISRGDFLKVQIPATNISKKIKIDESVFKFGSRWNIWGKNESRKDIIELSLWWTTTSPILDDVINEIANRWKQVGTEKIDRLDGNITPIMPFDIPEEILGDAIVTFYVIDKTTEENINTIVEIVDEDYNKLRLISNEPHIIPKGTYTYSIEHEGYITKTGTINIERDATEIILLSSTNDEEEPPTEPTESTYTITVKTPFAEDDPNELWYGETYIYTVKKFVDGVEVAGNFTFEISDTSKATISNTTNNSCDVTANDVFGNSTIKLIATDTDTSQVAIEKSINIIGK